MAIRNQAQAENRHRQDALHALKWHYEKLMKIARAKLPTKSSEVARILDLRPSVVSRFWDKGEAVVSPYVLIPLGVQTEENQLVAELLRLAAGVPDKLKILINYPESVIDLVFQIRDVYLGLSNRMQLNQFAAAFEKDEAVVYKLYSADSEALDQITADPEYAQYRRIKSTLEDTDWSKFVPPLPELLRKYPPHYERLQELLKESVGRFDSVTAMAATFGVDRRTIRNILDNVPVSDKIVPKLLKKALVLFGSDRAPSATTKKSEKSSAEPVESERTGSRHDLHTVSRCVTILISGVDLMKHVCVPGTITEGDQGRIIEIIKDLIKIAGITDETFESLGQVPDGLAENSRELQRFLKTAGITPSKRR